MKRAVDILFILLFAWLWLPLLILTSLFVAVCLGWPVFFIQERTGLHGQSFRLIKFRTMRMGAGDDRDRLTRLGSWLRAASLDELPELWNVLRGEMALVGPRPLLVRYLTRYTPEQMRRHEVRPGITGWAQVNGRNAISWEQKFAFDVWYVDNQSLWLDLKILWLTIAPVFSRSGIHAAKEATMDEFFGESAGGKPGLPKKQNNA